MEHLAAARNSAKAVGDKDTLALLREISRLHWVLLRSHQVVDFVISPSGNHAEQKARELREILNREPLIIKQRAIFTSPVLSLAEVQAKRKQDFDR